MRRFVIDTWARKDEAPVRDVDILHADTGEWPRPACDVYEDRGVEEDWPAGAWPPQRVRITVEWLDAPDAQDGDT